MTALNLLRLPLQFGVSTVTDGPEVFDVTGDPNGTFVAPMGSLAIQVDPAQLWQNAGGGDVWTLVSGAGGAAVYPPGVFVTFGTDPTPTISLGLDSGSSNFFFGGLATVTGDSPRIFIGTASATGDAGDLILSSGTGGVRSGDIVLDTGGDSNGPRQGVIAFLGTVTGGAGAPLTDTGSAAFTGSVPIFKRVTVPADGASFSWPVRQQDNSTPAQLCDVMFQKTGGAGTATLLTVTLDSSVDSTLTINVGALADGQIVRLGAPEVSLSGPGLANKNTNIVVSGVPSEPVPDADNYAGILTVTLVN